MLYWRSTPRAQISFISRLYALKNPGHASLFNTSEPENASLRKTMLTMNPAEEILLSISKKENALPRNHSSCFLGQIHKYFYLASLKAQWGGTKTLGGILRYTLGIKKIKKLNPTHCPAGLENGVCVFAMFSIEMYRKNVKNSVFQKK